jgi:hypothetical protein
MTTLAFGFQHLPGRQLQPHGIMTGHARRHAPVALLQHLEMVTLLKRDKWSGMASAARGGQIPAVNRTVGVAAGAHAAMCEKGLVAGGITIVAFLAPDRGTAMRRSFPVGQMIGPRRRRIRVMAVNAAAALCEGRRRRKQEQGTSEQP